ncbi:hypothetical protein SAMN05192553_101656 [Cyclobacterium xiamenense]|uniref:Uncharacterized protein n=1 Tax=Cyclobacterium xiamenense TaxID=1297121 RepID=A0A1H6UHU1_9BACT|nr:hypothetical protein [Cyclobacterium xiamenense]SEI87685.1 hypothetical protein SAMN05192553_101656 [Cyclobacterium xiamenense]
MSGKTTIFWNNAYRALLSEKTKERSENAIIGIAVAGFIVHLSLIILSTLGIVETEDVPGLLDNPIASIYTPFSFILVYEVYLLVYFLPKSITYYIGKQYEIILLVLIRRLFKDLAQLDLENSWFSSKDDLQFTYDIGATLIIFTLIFVFYYLNGKRNAVKQGKLPQQEQTQRFIETKKKLAIGLIVVLFFLAIYSFGDYFSQLFFDVSLKVESIKDINNIFFDEFFTILILSDVLLLLISYTHTSSFRSVIRNSGFVISTILIKLSFSTEGILNNILVVAAISFGVLILLIHNFYEKIENLEKMEE